VLKAALEVVGSLGLVSSDVSATARRIASTMPDVISSSSVREATYVCERDRRFDLYGEALNLAALILRDNGIDQNVGPTRVRSFLIPMAQLFERAVTRAFERVASKRQLAVRSQRQTFLDREERISIRPDVLVHDGVLTLLVADAKYIDAESGGPTAGNFQQIVTYMASFGCVRSVLVLAADGNEVHEIAHHVDAFGRILEVRVMRVGLTGNAAALGRTLETAATMSMGGADASARTGTRL
jgi:5-methylcytosine-specific restriction endonuclease McrBC regulatory subunit McrC